MMCWPSNSQNDATVKMLKGTIYKSAQMLDKYASKLKNIVGLLQRVNHKEVKISC